MSGVRGRARRLWMGAATLLGRPQGFFIPYRYAAGVDAPEGYPEIERIMAAAEPQFRNVLGAIDALSEELDRIAWEAPAPAPRWGQSWFPGLDAAALYALIRTRAPKTVIEVGSGHSTRFAAQAIVDGALDTRQIAIDPAPRATLGALAVDWRRELLGPEHLPLFDALGPGDVAFFDSSHILMPGTDVDLILSRIVPRLRAGVLIHIHDIFLPAPYPAAWAWRGYNEQNGVAALISGGAARPIFASQYVRTRLGATLRPPPDNAPESALWLERIAPSA